MSDIVLQLLLPILSLQLEKAKIVRNDIRKEVANAIGNYCNCSFSTESIQDGIISCRSSPLYVTYRSDFRDTQGLDPLLILVYIEDWVSTSPTILIGPYMVDVDSTCSVRISSLADEECPPPEIRALEDEILITRNPNAISCIKKCGGRRGLASAVCED